MDKQIVLAAYDRDIRSKPFTDDPMFRFEWDGPVFRFSSDNTGTIWNGVNYTDLNEETADVAIARQIAYFGDLGHSFEWKLHDYDRPDDLAGRLEAAGFRAEPAEAFVACDLGMPIACPTVPDGVEVRQLTDPSQLDAIIPLYDAVYGAESMGTGLVAEWKKEMARHPDLLSFYGAFVGDVMVCSGRMEIHKDTAFASLWGGATLPEWRRRGIYSALISLRAESARRMGLRWLTADCSPDSRPILERRGFTVLSMITPFVWMPKG